MNRFYVVPRRLFVLALIVCAGGVLSRMWLDAAAGATIAAAQWARRSDW